MPPTTSTTAVLRRRALLSVTDVPVPDAFMHQMSSFVHGSLTALHVLGVCYGIRRKNWYDVAAHTFGVAFSVRATAHHIKQTKEKAQTG